MIEFNAVTKFFGKTAVLKGLTFSVADADTCALIGLSGCGKTTALKLICGLYLPDSGDVRVQGLTVGPNTLTKIRSQIGYVIQEGGLFPHLTARQNLHIVGKELGWPEEQIASRIEELSKLTKLSPNQLERYPRQLSGGQRQRVGLMRALFKDPPVLLLDEPLGSLDPITRRELQIELRDLFSDLKKTVLLVTHDLYEAGFLAKQILLLDKGQALQTGALNDLIEQPANEFVRRFVESQSHHIEDRR